MTSEDLLVRDVWKTFPHRKVVGHLLTQRVGARGWDRSFFGKFASFFARVGLSDPWDPSAPETEVGLGEVGLGQPKRQVAPHAAPPAAVATGPKLPNIPGMPPPSPKATEPG